MITSIVLGLLALLLIVTMLFGIKPFIKREHSTIGLLDYQKGIPVKMVVGEMIRDTSLILEAQNASFYGDGMLADSFYKKYADKITYGDTIVVLYDASGQKGEAKVRIGGSKINSITAFLNTKDFKIRVLFHLPVILEFLVWAFLCFQLARLLDSIQAGVFFDKKHFSKIFISGIAIILVQVILFIISIFQNDYFQNLHVSFESTIPHFRAPVSLDAYHLNNFDGKWFLIGCILVIIASAFKNGYKLKKEQELTI